MHHWWKKHAPFRPHHVPHRVALSSNNNIANSEAIHVLNILPEKFLGLKPYLEVQVCGLTFPDIVRFVVTESFVVLTPVLAWDFLSSNRFRIPDARRPPRRFSWTTSANFAYPSWVFSSLVIVSTFAARFELRTYDAVLVQYRMVSATALRFLLSPLFLKF